MARIISDGSDVDPAQMCREVQQAMLPTAEFIRQVQQAMLPTAEFIRQVQQAMLPTAEFVRQVQRAMVDVGSVVLAVRDVIAAPSTADILDALKDLDDEINRSSGLAGPAPALVRWDSHQLRTLTTYLIALHVLVVAVVLQTYHPGVVDAVANVLAWTAAVFMIDQALRSR